MLKAIDITQRTEFISKHDTEDQKTVFILRPLSGLEMMSLSSGTPEDIEKMIVKSIVEVKNYTQTYEKIEDVVRTLNLSVLGEILNFINVLNNLTGEDTKNS